MTRPKTKPAAARKGGFLPAFYRFLLRLTLVLAVVASVFVIYLDAIVTEKFEGHRWTVPARVFARPLELQAGGALTPGQLQAELQALGYRRVERPAQRGEYAVSADGHALRMVTRGFRFADGSTRSQTVALQFSAARIEQMTAADPVVRLEPVEIGGVRPGATEDRILMQLGQRPPFLVEALVATEDRDFFEHAGVSPRGILRALFVNVSAGEVQQGGSTLTQQLVKNFYLDSERTLWRKGVEAVMAVLLEVHYDKNTILETYLNEIYLGQSGRRAVHGFALASRFYFGRPVSELRLHEVALLVGVVKGPSVYNPWKHPERVLARRNTVLDAMVATGALDAGAAAAAKQQPLGIVPTPRLSVNRYPAFLAMVRGELQRTLQPAQREQQGLLVFSTLDPGVQQAAEQALVQTLDRIERERALNGLEAALVVAAPRSGAIEAAVGGRDVDYAGFNRVADARRQVGSLMKPVVYLTALQYPRSWNLASLVSDAPLSVKVQGQGPWRPANYDRNSHGNEPGYDVTLIDALANSWNLATARLGMEIGVDQVLRQARALGVTADLPPYPSVLLGSASMTPAEVLGMYQPLANGGRRLPTHTVRAVLAADGSLLYRAPAAPQQVVAPGTATVLTYALQEVMVGGTGMSAYQVLPPALNAAGKTGTTDDARDSWFAGYTGNHLAVAWVGFDDNRSTPLSGASGALRVWTDAMARLPQVPLGRGPGTGEGVEWLWLSPGGKTRAAEGCGEARLLPVVAGTGPEETSLCGTAVETARGIKGFFRRLFGRDAPPPDEVAADPSLPPPPPPQP